jgi:hypothetical protein
MPCGTFRFVLLFRSLAIKVPRLRNAQSGMRCNRWEREMWRTWQPKFRWGNLCPIKFADYFGVIVIMSRAQQPVTVEEIEAADPDYYPDVDVEWKPENWGRLNGSVVAVDYGLWDARAVHERHEYLKSKDGPAMSAAYGTPKSFP